MKILLKIIPLGRLSKKYLEFLLDRHQLIRADAGYSAGIAFWKPTAIPGTNSLVA